MSSSAGPKPACWNVVPIPSCEPRPGRAADRGDPGQLALPVPIRRTHGASRPSQRLAGEEPNAPSEPELRAMLAALVEVVDGRRPASALRRRVIPPLQENLKARPRLDIGPRVAIERVHVVRPQPRVLEVCATVHALPAGRAFAVSGELRVSWHGWAFTAFDVLLPQSRSYAAA